ncbi:MAG: CD3072 family TudS-related putative desulfidase [Candidatus Firestonebacteria bacterium]
MQKKIKKKVAVPFNDHRSKKIIVLTHCILNQNARIDGAANLKGVISQVLNVVVKRGYGVLQMPCPEIVVSDLRRSKRTKEMPYVRQMLETKEGRKQCYQLAKDIVKQIKDYINNGFFIPAIIGKDGSPACGVVTTSKPGKPDTPGDGVFIEELHKVLIKNEIDIPIIGMKDDNKKDIKKTVKWLEDNLKLE